MKEHTALEELGKKFLPRRSDILQPILLGKQCIELYSHGSIINTEFSRTSKFFEISWSGLLRIKKSSLSIGMTSIGPEALDYDNFKKSDDVKDKFEKLRNDETIYASLRIGGMQYLLKITKNLDHLEIHQIYGKNFHNDQKFSIAKYAYISKADEKEYCSELESLEGTSSKIPAPPMSNMNRMKAYENKISRLEAAYVDLYDKIKYTEDEIYTTNSLAKSAFELFHSTNPSRSEERGFDQTSFDLDIRKAIRNFSGHGKKNKN